MKRTNNQAIVRHLLLQRLAMWRALRHQADQRRAACARGAVATQPARSPQTPRLLLALIALLVGVLAAPAPATFAQHMSSNAGHTFGLRGDARPAVLIGQDDPPALPMPDALENDWNPATAAPIAIGSIYDRTLICPVAWGCRGGDHDYMRVAVKAGARYRIAAFDLGPGTDTVIDLFFGDPEQPTHSNDDAYPTGFASMLTWVAPSDGELLLRVAPRDGAMQPVIPARNASSYRFAIALDGSSLARQIQERVATAAGIRLPTAPPAKVPPSASPTPTSADTPTGSPAPVAPPSAPAPVSTDAVKGSAIVRAESTVLRERPALDAPEIERLEHESAVVLLGKAQGAWVRVQPVTGVVPGWVFGPDLYRPNTAQAKPDTAKPTIAPTATPGVPATPAAPAAPVGEQPITAPATSRRLVVQPLAPLPLPAAPDLQPRAAVAVSITMLARPAAAERGSNSPGKVKETPASPTAIGAVRIQLVNAFGDVLAEALTRTTGPVVLIREVAPEEALFVRVPVLGIQMPVNLQAPNMTLLVPM